MRKLINSFLLLLLFCSPSWAATQVKKVVAPSGGDYTSLESCMNAMETDAAFGGDGDLVGEDKYFDVEISGTWSSADTTAVTIHNYTTDATRYINIYTTGDARHHGIASSSYYILSNANNIMNVGNSFVKVDGLQFTGMTTIYAVAITTSSASNIFKNNIVYLSSNPARESTGINIAGTYQSNNYVYNNIIYGFNQANGGNGISVTGFDNTSNYIYNNTVYGNKIGIYNYGNSDYANGLRIVNNICNGNTTDYSLFKEATTATDNISEDTTSPNDEWDSTAVDFVNEGTDFHLAATADAIDQGTDLSGTFTTDIDGDTRSGTWDIGADEYAAAATSQGQVIIIEDTF